MQPTREPGPLKIDVILGGPGREAAVSRVSGAAIAEALRRAGADVAEIDLSGELDPARLRPGSMVFNIVHGTYGEDGQLQRLLEREGRAYVGSDAAASALCMDKDRTRAVCAEAGLAIAWGRRIDPQQVTAEALRTPHAGPWVLKPCCDGSSVGLRMLPSTSFLLPALEELVRELGPIPFLLEERLPGPEYTVGIIEQDGQPRALPPINIVPATEFYDYQAKYHRDDTRYLIVEEPALVAELHDCALRAWRACQCRDLARVDLIAGADGRPRLIEINTLPGFTSHSLLPKAAARAGISFQELCLGLVRNAAARSAAPRRAGAAPRA
jgi:D-alanine-D-alanine ligase